ncbi:MAG TPA: hypothetical protein VH480_13195 [Streptosporangiaceae bacterium]|jgi:uncharacterized BrkB/YihY/UPF0761 family membrane protein
MRKLSAWTGAARQRQQQLEQHPWAAFPLASIRRFNKIEGKHLALVIAANLFLAVIPLLIILYAFLESFSPQRSFGILVVHDLHLTGSTARIVRDTFATASSGRHVALSISVISLLITGLDVSATVQIAYARSFSMAPLRGVQKYLRGAAWLLVLLAGSCTALALRYLAAGRPLWFGLAMAFVLTAAEFGFYLLSPRLLLDLPFAWRDLVPGAAVCTGAAVIVHVVAAFLLRKWVSEYGHAYGAFGVGLALIAFVGVIASFWVWIAAVMGVWWERKAGPGAVAAMEKLAAEISAP